MKRFIIISLAILAGLYLITMLLIYTQQRRFLYFPPPIYLTPQAVELSGFEQLSLPNAGGDILGWWSPPQNSSKPTVMFFHGNGSAIFSNHDIYRALQAEGYGVFALAYPGYPGRGGAPTQQSLSEAAVQAYDTLIAKDISPDSIAFYGTSLGGGVAAQLTVQRRPALLISEASFTSVADMAQHRFPLFPARHLARDKFNSVSALDGQNIPLLWMHGTRDQVIPFRIGQEFFETYNGPKIGHIIEGGRHTDLWYLGGRDLIMGTLEKLETGQRLITVSP